MHPFNLSSFYWLYCVRRPLDLYHFIHGGRPCILDFVPPWGSIAEVHILSHLHCWTIHLLFLLCHSVSCFSLRVLFCPKMCLLEPVHSASLVPGQHRVLDPARHQLEDGVECQTANGMVNSPWRSVVSHCKHRQALLGALAI